MDVFVSFDASLGVSVTSPSQYRIDVGFDHKENLLKKAGQLGLYGAFKQGDTNQAPPFADGSLNSVFCNIVYWMDLPQTVSAEIARIIKAGSRACLMLRNATYGQFNLDDQLYVKGGDPRWKFLELLDCGRFAYNIRQAKATGRMAWDVRARSSRYCWR